VTKYFLFGAKAEQQTLTLFKQSLEKVSGIILAKRLREIAKFSFELTPIKICSIYIQPINDKLVPKHNLEIFKRCCKDLKVVKVSGPHFILQTNPKTCADIIVNETER